MVTEIRRRTGFETKTTERPEGRHARDESEDDSRFTLPSSSDVASRLPLRDDVGDEMAKPAPYGPLLGNERGRAIELLTDKQFTAYRYRREGQAWNWIAQRMGVSRPAVIHLVAKAEKRLGYEATVTPQTTDAVQKRCDQED
jgi:DNA-binding CsgD family transcriptional regulator